MQITVAATSDYYRINAFCYIIQVSRAIEWIARPRAVWCRDLHS
jgi:hypothetical protein